MPQVPISCPGVPDDILHPIANWAHQQEYTSALAQLALMFSENMQAFLKDGAQVVGNDVLQQILSGAPQQHQHERLKQRWQPQMQPGTAAADSGYSVHDQEEGAQYGMVDPVQRQLKQLNLQRSKVDGTRDVSCWDMSQSCCSSLLDGSDDDLHVHLTVVESLAVAGKLAVAGSAGAAAAASPAGPCPRGT